MADTSNQESAPGSPTPISTVCGEFDDFDLLEQAAEGWGLDWIQLDRGPLRARVEQTRTPSILANRFRFNRKFHQMGTVPSGMRTYGAIAPSSSQIEWRRIKGSERHLVVFPTEEEFEFLSHPGFCGDTISLPKERLFQVADCLGFLESIKGMPSHQAIVEADPLRIEIFRRRLDEFHALAEISARKAVEDSVVADAEFEVISALVEVLSEVRGDDGHPELSSRSRAFCVALTYIRDHASRSPSIEEICQVSDVSWRTLDYAFRERFDLTPKQYLKAVQLSRVRRNLVTCEPGATVSEIAGRWGFWHMGQFARDYRRQFGELPSETARRA